MGIYAGRMDGYRTNAEGRTSPWLARKGCFGPKLIPCRQFMIFVSLLVLQNFLLVNLTRLPSTIKKNGEKKIFLSLFSLPQTFKPQKHPRINRAGGRHTHRAAYVPPPPAAAITGECPCEWAPGTSDNMLLGYWNSR